MKTTEEIMDHLNEILVEHKALIEVAKQAAITSGWMQNIGLAGRGDLGSKVLQNLEQALNELDNTLANHKTK